MVVMGMIDKGIGINRTNEVGCLLVENHAYMVKFLIILGKGPLISTCIPCKRLLTFCQDYLPKVYFGIYRRIGDIGAG